MIRKALEEHGKLVYESDKFDLHKFAGSKTNRILTASSLPNFLWLVQNRSTQNAPYSARVTIDFAII